MRRIVLLAVLALAVLFAGVGAVAQEAGDGVRIQEVSTDDYPEVQLLVTAITADALSVEDFTVLEGEIEYPVDAAEPVAAEAIEAVLIIDTSGSMAGAPLAGAQAAANSFLDQLPEAAQVAVVEFGDEAAVVQPLTDDIDGVRAAIDGLDSGGETALYDAVNLGLDQLNPGGADNLVVLTDGADTVSGATIEETEDRLGSFTGAFFAVELEAAENDPESLARLAEAAGGLVANAADPDALEAIYADIAVAVTSQFVLAYTSEGAGVQQVSVAVAGVGSSEPVPVGLPAAPSTTTSTSEATTTTTTPVAPTVPEGSSPEAPFFAQGPWLAVGLGAFFLGVAGVVYFLFSAGEGRGPRSVRPTFRTRGTKALSGVSKGLVTAAERAGSAGGSRGLDQRLDRAGIRLRAGEFIVVFLALSALGLGVGWVIGGSLWLGLVAAVLVLVVAMVLPGILGDRRQRKFEDELPDVLSMLSSTIRTGYAPIQATELVAREVADPAASELSRAVAETRLGRDYIDALGGVADRMESEDFRWVVDAMNINRDIGGDVSEILDQVAETIRARVQLRRMVAALSAEGRISAWILVAVPFFLAWFLWVRDRNYLTPLVDTLTGIAMMVGALVLMVIGIFVIRNIVRIEE